MNTVFFLVRHTPFWAIPLGIIAGEWAYICWLKEKRKSLYITLGFMLFCFLMLVYYYWSGGPEASVDKIINWWGRAELFIKD